MSEEVVILGGARTRIGAFGGAFKDVSAVELGVVAVKEAVKRSGVRPDQVNAPFRLPGARWGERLGHGKVIDHLLHEGLTDAMNDIHMGITAENLVERYNLSRDDQDMFAVESQTRAAAAIREGRFKDEIVAVPVPQKKGEPKPVDTDEYPRADTTLETLAKLKPAFKKNGTVTAGNASGMTARRRWSSRGRSAPRRSTSRRSRGSSPTRPPASIPR